MKLISGVNIKEFRSIRQTQGILNSFGNFNTFAGLNNSGKSNFLRALNAYFTGYTEPANALNYRNDYNKYDLHKKKHEKTLEISVTFSLPSNFKFRAKLENIKSYLNSDSFTITKKWYRDKNTPDYFFNNEETPVDFEARQKLDQFLSLINFRYIPNRVMPIDIIKNEHQALRDVLIRRLGLRTKTSRKTFSKIQEISSHLIGSLSERLHKMNVGSSKIRLATPKDWTDMIFAFGYRLGDGQTEIEDSMQGSGIQSLLMLETLYLIDKDYFQQFGWRQASIWAIEEPESSLHCSLEAQVASFLREISIVESSRLQIFATTHSEVMIQYADKSFFTEQKNNETNFKGDLNVRDMLLESGKAGVSKYVHPIIHHPLEPIILVDGENDIPFIEKSIALLFPKLDIKVTYLGNWDKGKTGGENDIYSYLKANKNVVAYRDKCAPIIISLIGNLGILLSIKIWLEI